VIKSRSNRFFFYPCGDDSLTAHKYDLRLANVSLGKKESAGISAGLNSVQTGEKRFVLMKIESNQERIRITGKRRTP